MQVQNSKNVTNPCLLGEKLDDAVINIIPPPGYHLYEHNVSKITNLFANKTLKEFLEKKTIIRYGYNGGDSD